MAASSADHYVVRLLGAATVAEIFDNSSALLGAVYHRLLTAGAPLDELINESGSFPSVYGGYNNGAVSRWGLFAPSSVYEP